ncbi:MAG: class I SAM-dependent methyltransferase, partial [bacterium]
AGRVNKRLKLHTKGEVKEYVESVRLYRQEDFSPMLSKVGLVQVGTHGDLEGRPFRPIDSPRLIIWAQKPR